MAEEQRFQAPGLCANNCGFFGSPAMQDLCSKCYRDLQLKEQRSSFAKLAFNQTLIPSQLPSPAVSLPSSSSPSPPEAIAAPSQTSLVEYKIGSATQSNRCATCRKRVGLTGFKCRCGLMLCGNHRYPEQHGCGFDFKGMDRDQIAKANPVVKGEKLHKI